MSHMNTILRTAAIVGLLGSTSSIASAQTRSAAALPSAGAVQAPTTGVRSATTLKKKSGLASESILPLALGAAIVAGGIYIAVEDSSDDEDDSDSPG